MFLLGKGLKLILEDFHEFKTAVDTLLETKNHLEKSLVFNSNLEISSVEHIGVDEIGQIYLNLHGEYIKVIVYIDNQILPMELNDNISLKSLNRYHLYRCETVNEIFHNNYIFYLTARSDNLFKYRIFKEDFTCIFNTNQQELLVCEHCLTQFNMLNNTNYTQLNFLPHQFFQVQNLPNNDGSSTSKM